jgi:hypothetical protein
VAVARVMVDASWKGHALRAGVTAGQELAKATLPNG